MASMLPRSHAGGDFGAVVWCVWCFGQNVFDAYQGGKERGLTVGSCMWEGWRERLTGALFRSSGAAAGIPVRLRAKRRVKPASGL